MTLFHRHGNGRFPAPCHQGRCPRQLPAPEIQMIHDHRSPIARATIFQAIRQGYALPRRIQTPASAEASPPPAGQADRDLRRKTVLMPNYLARRCAQQRSMLRPDPVVATRAHGLRGLTDMVWPAGKHETPQGAADQAIGLAGCLQTRCKIDARDQHMSQIQRLTAIQPQPEALRPNPDDAFTTIASVRHVQDARPSRRQASGGASLRSNNRDKCCSIFAMMSGSSSGEF